jgi:hypothetical protein
MKVLTISVRLAIAEVRAFSFMSVGLITCGKTNARAGAENEEEPYA